MPALEEALELEELQYEKLLAELGREEQEAAQRIDHIMGATGNYQSTARFSAMIELKAKNLATLINGQLSFRRELAQAVPELARDSELYRLMQRINGDINRFWTGLTQAYPSQFAGVLRPQIDRETVRLRDHAKRDVEIMKREHRLNLRKGTDPARAVAVHTGGGPAIVNLGEIRGNVQQVIGTLNEAGHTELVGLLDKLRIALETANSIAEEDRIAYLEQVRFIAAQAGRAPQDRQPSVVQGICAGLRTGLRDVASVTQILNVAGTALAHHFGFKWLS